MIELMHSIIIITIHVETGIFDNDVERLDKSVLAFHCVRLKDEPQKYCNEITEERYKCLKLESSGLESKDLERGKDLHMRSLHQCIP